MIDLIRPEFKLVQAFMPGLVTSKSDEDLIKNEHARLILETPFSFYKSMGNFLDASDSEGSGPIWPKFELFQEFMPVLVTFKFEED